MKIISNQILEALPLYNETEVRFHIVDPVLRKLGYPGEDDVYLKLEDKLEYPYFHIGHRNRNTDTPLGFPDYRAGLKGGRGSFIIEAKSTRVGLSEKDVEQAHSYAAHAQVGANYFVLCDGNKFVVYETLSGSQCEPIVAIQICDLDTRFHELENILSPNSLAKNCHVAYDAGLKLCDGLGSSAKILSGEYDMQDWAFRIYINDSDQTEAIKAAFPQIAEIDNQLAMMEREFELKVAGGLAERNAEGRIGARVNFSGVTRNSLAAMKLLGIDRMSFSTKEKFLSVDSNNPTVFESTADFALDKGTKVPPLFGDTVPIDADINGDIFITARMYKEDELLHGEYVALTDYRFGNPMIGAMKAEMDLIGKFSLRLLV